MSKWIKAAGFICVSFVLGAVGNVFAQEDHLIENQRYVVGIDDFAWGDTYVGKYTSTNGLIITNYVSNGETNEIQLSVSSLTVGSESNFLNTAYIGEGGELQIEGTFTVLGTNNGNGLLIDEQGTLFMESDFDAAMGGFYYNSGANLKVGGEVSNLDNVEGGLNFNLIGQNAMWAFGTNILTIGALSDSNSVTLSSRATLDIDNIDLGALGTVSNKLTVTERAIMTVRESIDIFGTSNTVEITSNGVLAVYFDFAATTNLDISFGGILEAHNGLNYGGGITNGGGIIMTGDAAIWTNLSGSTLSISQSSFSNEADTASFVTITNGATVRVGDFNIEGISGETTDENEIVIIDGGKLIVENGGTVADEGARLLITEGGRLILESDYNINGFIQWYNGGIIEAFAEAPKLGRRKVNDEYIENGSLFLQDGQILILNGPNARWIAPTNNLHVGDLSADNHLIITNGGQAFANSVSIGDFEEAGNNNSILITGTNSALYSTTYAAIGGTIDSGNWIAGGISNSITVANGGLLSVGTTLHNRNTTGTSGLNINPGGVVEAQDYYQTAGAYLMIYTDNTGTNSGLLRVTNTAEFETAAQVGFDAVSDLAIGQAYTNMIVESGTLIVGGITNATTADLDALEKTGGSLVTYNLWETNQNIYAAFSRRSISEGGGIEPDSMLDIIADEIDRLASEGNVAASNQVQILSNMGSDQERKLQMEQMYSYELPTYMHNQGVFGGIDQVRARGSSAQEPSRQQTRSKPKGAAGPHSADQGLQGWAKVYGNFGSRDRDNGSDFVDGYDAQTYGTVIGFDQAFGDWLFGLAGGYAGSTLDGDNGDESEGETGYGILYANYGTNDWFGNVGLAYGLTDIDNTSGTDFGVSSSTKASQSAFYIGGGYQFEDEPTGSLLRPSLGIQTGLYDQDAYTESGNVIVKDVDGFDRWSAVSSFGASVIYPKSGKKMDMELLLRAYWLHEFNGDDEQVGYTLVGSDVRGQFVMRSPDQDAAQFGLGYVAKGKNGWQLRADIDVQLSETFTSTTLSGALLYEF